MKYLLGIDIGTSSTKAAVFDMSGSLIVQASKDYVFKSEKPGYAQQNPNDWWSAVCESVSNVLSMIGNTEIAAVGFSGQMHGCVALDSGGNPVYDAILHCDVRSKAEADELQKRFGESITDIVKNPIFPGFQGVTLEWMKNNQPELLDKVKVVLCPKDYVRYKLTGEIGTEHTDASGTLLYDLEKGYWSKRVFDMIGIDQALVPEKIQYPFEIAGTVSEEAAALTGLAKGTPVVYGGADQAMHSVGNGVYRPGVMTATIGTSGQVQAISDQAVKNPNLNTHLFRHVRPNSWYVLGAVLFAGSTLSWFKRNFSCGSSFEELSGLADNIPAGSNGLMFLPCLGGERTPYMDADARGVFLGISMAHNKAHFSRAIMEGVSYAMKTSIETVSELTGGCERLICAGGGVKGSVWAQIQADIYGRPIYVSQVTEQACLGAAITAGIGIGAFADLSDGCTAMCDRNMKIICPNDKVSLKYQELYQDIYLDIFESNKQIFKKLSSFE